MWLRLQQQWRILASWTQASLGLSSTRLVFSPFEQVLASGSWPGIYPEDVKKRATEYLEATNGAGSGAYTDSSGLMCLGLQLSCKTIGLLKLSSEVGQTTSGQLLTPPFLGCLAPKTGDWMFFFFPRRWLSSGTQRHLPYNWGFRGCEACHQRTDQGHFLGGLGLNFWGEAQNGFGVRAMKCAHILVTLF